MNCTYFGCKALIISNKFVTKSTKNYNFSELVNLEGEMKPTLEFLKWMFGASHHTYPAITFAMAENLMTKMGNEKDRKIVMHMKNVLSKQFKQLLGSNVDESSVAPDDSSTPLDLSNDSNGNLAPRNEEEELERILFKRHPKRSFSFVSPKNNNDESSMTSSIDDSSLTNFIQSIDKCEMMNKGHVSEEAIFIFPPLPTLTPFHHEPCATPFNFQYTAIFNSLGLPVTCCPVGLCSEYRTPLAVQIVGGMNKDHVTIAVALEIEKAFGGWTMPS